jgi:hypothetical protein
VKDKKNGELLIGVTVKVSENPSINVVANEYGFYSLSLPEGNYTIVISNPGYQDFEQQIKVDQNISLIFRLSNRKPFRNRLMKLSSQESRRTRIYRLPKWERKP